MTTDTSSPNVMVPASETPTPRRRASRLRRVVGVSAVIFVIALIGASTIKIGYFTQSPGSAVAIEHLIIVDGTEVFPSDGEIFFTTVRLTGEITLLEYLLGLADPSVDLRPSSEVLGTETREEQRERNLELMASSQEIAVRVALERLGFDVIVERGALISEVLPGSDSEGKLEPGDVVVLAGGDPIAAGPDLVAAIQALEPGADLMVTVERPTDAGEPTNLEISVTLQDNEGQAQLGVGVTTALDLVDLPFDVDISTTSVGGPSAGLALTLATLDLLSDGELTGGIDVATTGTIDIFGNVGPIGGAAQKAHAVRRAGIGLFLVPEANFEEANGAAGDGLVVLPVATLDDALAILAERGGSALGIDLVAAAG